MPVPTNLTPATALVIPSLPYSVTLDAFEVPTDDLWFRYDQTFGGYTIILLAEPDPTSTGTYFPVITVWTGPDPSTLSPYLGISGQIVPITVPIDTVITTYYFRVRRAGGFSPFTEQLFVQAIAGPVFAAPPGSIVVNDDVDGFPIAIVDSSTGEVLQQRPFPNGERADVLPVSGYSLWEDEAADTIVLYDNQLEAVATLTWDRITATTAEPPISSNHDDLFYVGAAGVSGLGTTARVRTVTTAGAFGSTTWELTGSTTLWAIAPSTDDTILYYVSDATGAVLRWDLINDVALSDLTAAPVGGYNLWKDIIVLADDSVVVYGRQGFSNYYIKRYSAAGSLLNTYTFAAGMRLNRMAYADGTSFAAWFFSTTVDGLAHILTVRASDGVVLSSVDVPYNSAGVWLGTNPGVPTTAISESCPFILLPPPGLPSLEPPGSYSLTGYPVTLTYVPASVTYETRTLDQRRLRRASHLSDEHRWLTYDRFQLDLQAGVGLTDGQGEDPQVMVRWSNDGGHTWSREQWRTAGRQGARKTRVIVRQTGRARVRTFEVVVSDPVAWYLAAAYLDVTPGDGN